MHSYYLSLLLDLLGKLGISESRLLGNSGLASFEKVKQVNLTAAQMDTISTNALELSNDRQLGLRVGSRMDIHAQGIFGYAIMTSATIGDALRLLVRYNRAVLPSVQIKLEPSHGRLEMSAQAAHLPNELERFYSELLYAAIMSSGNILIGKGRAAVRLELDYEPPYDEDQYRNIFGSKTRFNSNRCVLSFDEQALEQGISTADPVAREIFRRECDRLLSRDSHRGLVSERVQQVLLQAGSGFPTSAAVAQQLHMSESTLQRRLAKEGYRYQQLLDHVRSKLAYEYLQGTRLSVSEIASLLGFSDLANFRRAFKRWSNTTPSSIRNEGPGSAGRNPEL
jgi:AraC-like DNA-binding protein